MSDIIIAAYVTMAVFSAIVTALYLPRLPRALRDHTLDGERLFLLAGIAFHWTSLTISTAWFSASRIIRDAGADHRWMSDSPVVLLILIMSLLGAALHIRGATRLLVGPSSWWIMGGGALAVWCAVYAIVR